MDDLLFSRAERFLRLHARPLEHARFEYHFCGGAAESVLCALSVYQNTDGGFGNGLEPDTVNPHSAPLQTWAATEILREISCTQASSPMMRSLLDFLSGSDGFDGIRWRFTVATNNDFPHSPWMHDDGAPCNTFNPTAALAGFLLRYAPMNSLAYARAVCSAKAAVADYLHHPAVPDMHLIPCMLRLLEDCRAADVQGLDLQGLEQKLLCDARACVEPDPARWGVKYCCRPSHLVKSRSSLLYPLLTELIAVEYDFLVRTQYANGSWDITWRWDSFPDEWAVAQHHWKSVEILRNLMFLKEMKKIRP